MNLAYSVIRYIPSLLRGEAVNIGVALEEPGGGLWVKFVGSLSRPRLLFPDADTATLSLLRKYFEHVQDSPATSEPVFAYSNPGHVSLSQLAAETRNTMLQLSEPTVTISPVPDDELNDLFATFVAPREATASRFFASVQMAPARLRLRLFRRLDRDGLIGPGRLQQQFRVSGTVFPWEFDLGRSNGSITLVQSIALTGPDDIAVNRALLLAARVDDLRTAHTEMGRVIAAADQIVNGSPSLALLNHHGIEVSAVTDTQLSAKVREVVGAAS
jgi:hypothetical protein